MKDQTLSSAAEGVTYSKGKFTKGKWTFGNHHCGDGMRVFVQHEDDADQHDAICDIENWQTEEETHANAYLISSAPELLEACKLARTYLGKIVADGLLTNCAVSPKRALAIIDGAISRAIETTS